MWRGKKTSLCDVTKGTNISLVPPTRSVTFNGFSGFLFFSIKVFAESRKSIFVRRCKQRANILLSLLVCKAAVIKMTITWFHTSDSVLPLWFIKYWVSSCVCAFYNPAHYWSSSSSWCFSSWQGLDLSCIFYSTRGRRSVPLDLDQLYQNKPQAGKKAGQITRQTSQVWVAGCYTTLLSGCNFSGTRARGESCC